MTEERNEELNKMLLTDWLDAVDETEDEFFQPNGTLKPEASINISKALGKKHGLDMSEVLIWSVRDIGDNDEDSRDEELMGLKTWVTRYIKVNDGNA